MIKTKSTRDDYFIPLDDSAALDIPESVTGDESNQLFNDPSLALKPIRFIRRATSGLFSLLMVFVVWQSIQFFQFLYASHWVLAAVFSALICVLLMIVGKAILSFSRYQQDFRDINELQKAAETMQSTRSSGQGNKWLTQLKALYRGKPHQDKLEKALASLPDYSDDSEMMTHLDQHLFQPLDRQAISRISAHSQQTALVVALSPVAAIDMLLSAWRCLKMIDEICQIYGIRPSLPTRVRLLRMVFNQMALAGATDLISDQLADFASNKLVGTISAQAGSGLGIGLYSARIGFQVMDICRPLAFQTEQRPKLRNLARNIYSKLKNQFKDS
ncbi:TIGR01620 family protein [Endozoicomonas sp. (ex Bugula neritina AB1)]|nr:TIGR01620 family protein [Endozoicomonas sp. (ex Bugula neritina AB1)]